VIDAHSIDTGNSDRDAHLRGNEFLEMEKFPEITFTSTTAEKRSDGDFIVTGALTVKGVSKPVTIDFTYQGTAKDPYGNVRVGFEGKATINRRDFGVTTNLALETGGVLVGDKIALDPSPPTLIGVSGRLHQNPYSPDIGDRLAERDSRGGSAHSGWQPAPRPLGRPARQFSGHSRRDPRQQPPSRGVTR
jgi:hypothetical protein